MKKRFFCMFICAFLLFASCSTQETPSATTDLPTVDIGKLTFNSVQVRFSEAENGLGGPFGLNKNLEVAELNGITYAFEPGISLEDRASCILATEEILTRIGLDKNIQINIYTERTYDCSFINEGSVFTYLQNWKSPEYVSSLLQGIFGEYCNYGLIYGYANYLCQDMYGTPLDVYSVDWEYTGELNALDLNLLCFRSEFFTEADIESVQRISNTFVAEYIQTEGIADFQKLLENSGDTQNVNAFTDTLASFYASKGIDYIPTDILYRLGGRTYDYIVKCEYATMYIEKDWYDGNKNLCPYTYDGFLHQNYEDTRQFFSINIEQMGKYQVLFALESYNNDLDVYFTNHSGNTSYYQPGLHAIPLMNTGSFMHEYIHALTYEHGLKEYWAVEGLAEYCSVKYDYYGNPFSSADYNTLPASDRYRYVHELKSNLGRDIDVSIDFVQLCNAATYAYNYDDPNDDRGYQAGASFIGYLATTIGEEKVFEIICETHDFGEYTYDDLVAEWLNYISKNYSEYSKAKS